MPTAQDPMAPFVEGIIEHMNDDHADALQVYALARAGVQLASARMTRLSAQGFEVVGPCAMTQRRQHVWIAFPERCISARLARTLLVRMVKVDRAVLAERS